ncbi:MAG: N-acetylmuramoyl-L-alanine amidase [Bacteroidota bacterium]
MITKILTRKLNQAITTLGRVACFTLTIMPFTIANAQLSPPLNQAMIPSQDTSQIRRSEIVIDFTRQQQFQQETGGTFGLKGFQIQTSKHSAAVTSNVLKVPIELPEPFLGIAFIWTGEKLGKSTFTISFRTSPDSITWTEWLDTKEDEHLSAGSDDRYSDLVILDKQTRYIQYRLTLQDGEVFPSIKKLRIVLISPGVTPKDTLDQIKKLEPKKEESEFESLRFPIPKGNEATTVKEPALLTYPMPAFVSRTTWRCPDLQQSPRWTPTRISVSHAIIHHTVDQNTATDWAAVVKTIWELHANVRGWGDIGYNWLIDPNGILYQGRAWWGNTDDNVQAGHTLGYNGASIGIALIGQFHPAWLNPLPGNPTEVALTTTRRTLAWKFSQLGLDPRSQATIVDKFAYRISGHRNFTATDCPGDNLYTHLSSLRERTYALLNPPLAVTNQASDITQNSATLRGTVNPRGAHSGFFFQWGTSTAYGNSTPNQIVGSGTSDVSVTAPVIGLQPNTTYHFRLVAANSDIFSLGQNQSFPTPGQPPQPGILSVSPSDGFSSSGNQGGPFSPSSKTYTLSNTGGSSINWTATKSQTWVTLSSTNGTLAAGASTTVTVSINSNANSLSPGSYSDNMNFTNTTNGNGNTSRAVSLSVDSQQVTIITLAQGLNRPWNLTVDANSVYWVENDARNGAVKKVPINGGAVTTLSSGLVEPSAIAVDNSFVYWIERNNGSNGSIKKIPLGGGTPTTLATGLNNAQNHMALDASFIYFGDGISGGGGAIRKVSKSGGSVTTLVSTGIPNLTTAIAVDQSYVYFTDDLNNIKRVPVNGGTPTTIGPGNPSAMTLYGNDLYWVEYSSGTVKKMPKNGGTVTTLASGSNSPAGITTDGSNVFWIEFTWPGSVKKVPINGGSVTTIANEANTIGIAADSQTPYWAVSLFLNQGKIQKLGNIANTTITVSTTSLPSFGNVAINTNSSPQSYTVSGSNLTSNIVITAPTGFQVSRNQNSGFASSITMDHAGGSLGSTTIWVRFSPTVAQPYSGEITHTSTGAITQKVSISGTGTGQATLAVSSTAWTVPTNGGTSHTISVTNSSSGAAINYTISTSASWLTTSASLGTTPGSFTITATANNTGSQRSGIVTVTATTAGVQGSPRTITVTQATAGQIALAIGTGKVSSSGQPVSVPITVQNFANVGSISLRISYNNSILAFTGIANAPSNTQANASGGNINVSWFSTNPLSLSNDSKLFELQFTYNGGLNAGESTPLSFVTSVCELTNATGTPISVGYQDGKVELSTGYTISGLVRYHNSTQTPISNVTVALTPATGSLQTVMSGTDGSFLFPNVAAAPYTLSGAKTENWGGVTTADALLAQLHVVGSQPITDPLVLAAADVNTNGTITSADALMIQLRVVGLSNSFTKGDWVFSSHSLSVSSSNVTQNVSGLCVGDVNRSYMPSSGGFFSKQVSASSTVSPATVSLRIGAVQVPQASQTVNVPITVQSFSNVGSFTLRISYNSSVLTFLGVINSPSGIQSNAADGMLNMSWFSTSPLSKQDGGKLLEMQFRYNGGLSQSASSALTFVTSNCEVTDAFGAPLSVSYQNGSVLTSVYSIVSVPKEYSLIQNYPNPFNPTTTISYSIPQPEFVSLKVFDLLGREVATLVNEAKSPGNYKVKFDGSNLPSGVYLYRMQAGKFSESRKLMLLK